MPALARSVPKGIHTQRAHTRMCTYPRRASTRTRIWMHPCRVAVIPVPCPSALAILRARTDVASPAYTFGARLHWHSYVLVLAPCRQRYAFRARGHIHPCVLLYWRRAAAYSFVPQRAHTPFAYRWFVPFARLGFFTHGTARSSTLKVYA
ncbi:hypothetical protein C8R44DRAFT_895118 [Mycena epipterygia]|nr:hypothetical protein C8R44DRAFT_895118 [Mycena epipterygia]